MKNAFQLKITGKFRTIINASSLLNNMQNEIENEHRQKKKKKRTEKVIIEIFPFDFIFHFLPWRALFRVSAKTLLKFFIKIYLRYLWLMHVIFIHYLYDTHRKKIIKIKSGSAFMVNLGKKYFISPQKF